MDWNLVMAAVGSGGLVGILVKVTEYLRDRRQGQLQQEATAIANWQAIAEERAQEAADVDRELRWYRAHYPLLWAAYERCRDPLSTQAFPTSPDNEPPH